MRGKFEIRPYRETDREDVIALWRKCDLVVPWNDPEKDIEIKMSCQPELFLVGEIENEIVASAMGGFDGHRGGVFYLGVKPGHRKSGYGRLIMDKIAEKLKEMGCPKINIWVRRKNLDVVEFYKSLGYREGDVICMGKRIDEKPT